MIVWRRGKEQTGNPQLNFRVSSSVVSHVTLLTRKTMLKKKEVLGVAREVQDREGAGQGLEGAGVEAAVVMTHPWTNFDSAMGR